MTVSLTKKSSFTDFFLWFGSKILQYVRSNKKTFQVSYVKNFDRLVLIKALWATFLQLYLSLNSSVHCNLWNSMKHLLSQELVAKFSTVPNYAVLGGWTTFIQFLVKFDPLKVCWLALDWSVYTFGAKSNQVQRILFWAAEILEYILWRHLSLVLSFCYTKSFWFCHYS